MFTVIFEANRDSLGHLNSLTASEAYKRGRSRRRLRLSAGPGPGMTRPGRRREAAEWNRLLPLPLRLSLFFGHASGAQLHRQTAAGGGYSTNSRERTGSPNGMITRTSFPSHPHSYRHFLLLRETADTTSPAHTDNTACSKNRTARRTGRSRKRERNHTVSAPLPEIVSTAYLPSES